MKKEKTIKTYQRRTKTGKIVVVKQHTAKYDAAEDLKKALKKKGAGEELDALKKSKYEVLGVDLSDMSNEDFKEFAGSHFAYDEDGNEIQAPTTRSAFKKFAEKYFYGSEERSNFKEGFKEFMANGGAKGIGSSKSAKKSSSKASSAPSTAGFTADEYKQWYHWDVEADPKNAAAKKVEKVLKEKMGAKGYKKYFDEMTDSYSSRGHNKAYKALDLDSSAKTPKKTPTAKKDNEEAEALKFARSELKGYRKQSLSDVAHAFGKDSKEYKGYLKLSRAPLPKNKEKAAVVKTLLQGFVYASDDTCHDLLVVNGYPYEHAYSKGIEEIWALAKKYNLTW